MGTKGSATGPRMGAAAVDPVERASSSRTAAGSVIGTAASAMSASAAAQEGAGVALVARAASSAESLSTAIGNASAGSTPAAMSPAVTAAAKKAASPASTATGRASFASRTRRLALPNGAVLLVFPNDLSDTVSVRVRVRAGSYLDGTMPGLAEAMAGMLSRGTRSNTKVEIARRLESVGTTLAWSAQRYDVVGRGACLASNLPDLIETIVEELREPAFPADEIAKLKEEMKAAILQSDDDTGDRAYEALARSIYPEGHPLREPSAAERLAALENIGADDLRRFHQAYYGGSGVVMALSGKISGSGSGAERARKLLAALPRGKAAPVEAARGANKAASRQVVAMKDKANVDMMIGGAGTLRRKDPDYYAAYLANAVLGQSSLSSRLGAQVRDVEGLPYVIISRFYSADLLDGPWGVYLSVAPENVDRGLASTMNVL